MSASYIPGHVAMLPLGHCGCENIRLRILRWRDNSELARCIQCKSPYKKEAKGLVLEKEMGR